VSPSVDHLTEVRRNHARRFSGAGKRRGGLLWRRPRRGKDVSDSESQSWRRPFGNCCCNSLKQAGVAFTIFDKIPRSGHLVPRIATRVCGCDTPNHFYSYSFELHPGWSEYYAKRDELWNTAALRRKYGIALHLRLNTEVLGHQYDEKNAMPGTLLRSAGAQRLVESYNAVISAVGQINRPSFLYIPGAESFAGTAFHTGRWDPKVAVEANG